MSGEYITFLILVGTAILLALLGYFIKYRQVYWLISGYNTMTKEKKKNVDIENLARFSGNIVFLFAGILLAAALFLLRGQMWAAGAMFFLFIPLSIYTVIKAQSYDGNTRNPDGTMKKKAKVTVVLVVGLLVLTTAGAGVLLYYSSQPAEYSLETGTLKISGFYGEEIEFSKIDSITLKEQMPRIKHKSNGSALGQIKKGYFTLEDLGRAKLFLNSSEPPFIFLEAKSGLRILNTGAPAETEKLYADLREAWEKGNS
jgi:cadmium resistance protein CadD (predicted permease)